VAKDKDSVIGSAVCPSLTNECVVINSLVEEDCKIFISFASDTGGRTWYISEKIPGYGFKLSLNYPASKPLKFDYWIVLVEDQDNEQGAMTNGQFQPAPYCSDGWLYAGEECDDGNKINGDGCDATCIIEQNDQEPISNDQPNPNDQMPEELGEEGPVEEPSIEEPTPEPESESVLEPEPGSQAEEEQNDVDLPEVDSNIETDPVAEEELTEEN
jgi:cysteine-rich repeat protein